MAAQPDVLLHCFQNASSAVLPALQRCIDVAVAELQLQETKKTKRHERDELADCSRYLQANKMAWSERYAVDLLVEFTQVEESKPAGPAAGPQFTRLEPVTFGLVDDALLSQAIDGQRLLQNLLPAVEQKLAELDALVSSAMGLGYVAPERNPMRPEVFTRVLQRLASPTLEESAAAALSFKVLTKPLGEELVGIYSSSINLLKQASVTAASYQFRLQPTAPAMAAAPTLPNNPAAGAGQPPGSPVYGAGPERSTQAQASAVDLSDFRVKTGLLQDFLLGRSQAAEQGLSAPYYDDIDQELADLAAARDSAPAAFGPGAQAQSGTSTAAARLVPAVDRSPRQVDASSALSEQVWGPFGTSRARAMVRTQLKKEATKVSQVLSLDVVRELVNQVARDPRLLTPVREAIVALEPSLLRLALVDPRFFSDERHAGRKLMERVAQRSFKYNDEFADAFVLFFEDICRSFNQLNAATIDNAQPFAGALAQLEQAWDAHDQQDFDKRQQVLKALRFAEERQSSADQIAFELSSRSDLQQVPGSVLDFMFGPWALVMAHARLVDTRNQIDPDGYRSVVPDLVWSVKRDVTLKQPAKLIEMIPGLLDKLHSGLGLLGQDSKENDAFFESLMKLHRPVLKLRRLKTQRDAEESMAALLEAQEPVVSPAERLDKLRAQSDAPLWLGRDELDAAGFEDTQPTEPGELGVVHEGVRADCDDHGSQVGQGHGATPILTDVIKRAGEPVSPNSDVPKDSDLALEKKRLLTGVDGSASLAKEQAAATLRSLRVGHWVDLYSKHQWLRAQLVWASSKATLFMFISHGGRPHSMTQRSCEKLLAQRLLRPVDMQGVIAQALDGVAVVAEAQRQAAQASSGSSSVHAALETA